MHLLITPFPKRGSKTKSFLLLLIFLLITSTPVDAQRKFRFRYIRGVEYLLPPTTNLKLKDCILKEKFHYYYIRLTGLQGKYSDAALRLQKALVWHGSTNYFSNGKKPSGKGKTGKEIQSIFASKTGSCCICKNRYFKAIPLGNNRSDLFIQIDYKALLSDNPNVSFAQLSKDLLTTLYHFETTPVCNSHGAVTWPGGITQDVVEKIFEMIPLPQSGSLNRYAYNIEDESSLLLNPKISLRLDISKLNSDKKPPANWSYNLASHVMISFYKNDTGYIRQAPFTQFEKQTPITFPNNKFVKDNDTSILLASSADLQFSETIRDTKYILLLQRGMKRNNYLSSQGSGDNVDNDIFSGNCILVLNNELDKLLENKKGIYATYGSGSGLEYGYGRVFMTPLIHIFLNGNLTPVHLGSTLSLLQQQICIGNKFIIQRIHQGKYHTIKIASGSTLLLPGDKISF